MGLFTRVSDPFGTMGAPPRARSAPRLSASDKDAANFLAGAVARYGPLTREQVEGYAEGQRGSRRPGSRTTAHGLERIAAGMKPGEVVSGAVPWWRRF